MIRASSTLWGLLFLPLWLVGWTVGVALSFYALMARGDVFLMIWLIFAIPVWFVVAAVWLWWLSGREEILVESGLLTLRRRLLGLGWGRDVPLRDVTDVRVAGFFGHPWARGNYWATNAWWWGIGGGVITFNAAGKTHRFGIHLSEAEATAVVERLLPYLTPPGASSKTA